MNNMKNISEAIDRAIHIPNIPYQYDYSSTSRLKDIYQWCRPFNRYGLIIKRFGDKNIY